MSLIESKGRDRESYSPNPIYDNSMSYWQPHKAIPIMKENVITRKHRDYFYEMIYRHNENKSISSDISLTSNNYSEFLQNVIIRAIWMICNNIGINSYIDIRFDRMNIQQSFYTLIFDFCKKKNIRDLNQFYDYDFFIFQNYGFNIYSYKLNEDLVQYFEEIYDNPHYRIFINHFNIFINHNLVN